jgi:peptidoglycan-N-acetylglucosamine deacetylase
VPPYTSGMRSGVTERSHVERSVFRPEEELASGARLRRRLKRRRRRLRTSVAAFSAMGVLAFPMVSVSHVRDLTPWVGFKVRGEWEYGPPGTTFGATVRKFGLRPSDGSLYSVHGQILKPDIFPGRVLLNGHAPAADRPLHEGDLITIRNGKDRVEKIVTEVVHIPGGTVTDPQFHLGSVPGDQVIQKGKVSGEVVSSVFEPTGPGTRPKSVALTFDDGPWPTQTLQFLAVLKRFKVKATFFVVGYLAERYPEIIRAEVRAGMEIGDHSWDHPTSPPFGSLSPERIRDEIRRTRRVLAGYGIDTSVFRPPGGTYSDAVVKSAKRLGMRVVIWSIDPKDWKPGRTAAAIVKAVLSHVRPGSIILMHDGGGNRAATLAAMPKIIRGIRKMGLSFATLDQ